MPHRSLTLPQTINADKNRFSGTISVDCILLIDLEINDTTYTDRFAPYLDLHLEVGLKATKECNFTTKEIISIFVL